jgi:hypothetical protein
VATEQLTKDELDSRIAIALQEGPLYRMLRYKGAETNYRAPAQLKMFCAHEKCGFPTVWAWAFTNSSLRRTAGRMSTATDNDGFYMSKCVCNNCESHVTRFFYYWKATDAEGWFVKVGQYPELEERVSSELSEALDQEDLKVYKNALRMRNFGYGIASVAYMRRVIENRMNDILNVLYEEAKTHNISDELLAQHEKMMAEKRFSTKVDYAGALLPDNLRPQGKPNPMAVLHDLVSDGLHAKTDAECTGIFDDCRKMFEYVFGRMRVEQEKAREFVKSFDVLAKKKGASIDANPAGSVTDTPEKS